MDIAAVTTSALWLDQLGEPIVPRPDLEANPAAADADVAIVGGGFSGLWTAYYLAKADPTLRITVIEKHYCGFGASGRNGGWAEGAIAGPFTYYAKRSTHGEAMRLSRALFDAVDEIGRVDKAENIQCRYAKGGAIVLARNEPQAQRQRQEIVEQHELGFTSDEIRLLDADEARSHIGASNVRSAIHFTPCAAIDPARLVTGLARVVEEAGVRIVEQTSATAIGDGLVETDCGPVKAPVVIQATEAYTTNLKGQKRDLLPVYSLMIATEPMSDDQLAQVGLADRPTFSDGRFMVIYGQRTADNRIAFGGRGVPYLFGSRIDRSAELNLASHLRLEQTLVDLLPALKGIEITHRWGGVLGIPRKWTPGLRFDPMTGRGVLGGYVGEGVAAANLAGRTMADLIVGANTDRTSLPWVGVSNRRWEPEPFRWLGVRSSRWLMGTADDREFATQKPAKIAYRVSQLLRGG